MSGSRRTSRSNAFFAGVGVEEPQRRSRGQRRHHHRHILRLILGHEGDASKIKGPKGEFTQTLEDKTMFCARFEEGKEDAFTFDAADVADVDPKDKSWLIEEVTLGVSGGGMMASMMGSDWKLYTVTIQDVATGADLTLVCDDWVKDDAPPVAPRGWRQENRPEGGTRLAARASSRLSRDCHSQSATRNRQPGQHRVEG